MSVFKDAEQLYECIGGLMALAQKDDKVGAKISKSGVIVQFQYNNPDAIITVNAKDEPSSGDVYFNVVQGETDLKPDVVLSSTADVAHTFWHGKVNLMSALAKKEIVAQGPLPKILKLLPAVTPMYKVYPKMLKDKGYGDIALD